MLIGESRIAGIEYVEQEFPVYMTARINAPIQPINRGELFEDPLEILLKLDGIGEIIGGDSILSADGKISHCEIEIELPKADDATLQSLLAALADVGAPKGSMLIIEGETEEDDRQIPFGSEEGIAIRLNCVDLPEKTYQSFKMDDVIAELDRHLGEQGSYRTYSRTGTEYILYFYGPSAQAMMLSLGEYRLVHPLFERSVIEEIC